ncbi:MAG: LysR family transcriptional regulator [Granulosicoccus sp.]
MPLDFKQLEAFIWVADLGSFSKAAARLNTTQPNISIRIRSLESTLKVKLLERDAGSVRITARGTDLLLHARQVLDSAHNMIAAVGDTSLRTGTLRLGVTEMIVHTWLQDFLKVLKEQFPALQVELTIDLSVNLTKELFSRNIDLALQNGPFDRATSASIQLGNYPLIWVASPELGLPTTRKISTKQLSANPILTHARDTALFKEVSEHFNQVDMGHVRLVPSSNLAACLFLAINGMGVATLPKSMVTSALNRGDIVELKYQWTPRSLDFLARFDKNKSPGFVRDIAGIAQYVSND